MERFLHRFSTLPEGYSEGHYEGKRYGLTISRSPDGRRSKLYAEELGGTDHVSFNLYLLGDGDPHLKPCEMPTEKVISFVLGFTPE